MDNKELQTNEKDTTDMLIETFNKIFDRLDELKNRVEKIEKQ